MPIPGFLTFPLLLRTINLLFYLDLIFLIVSFPKLTIKELIAGVEESKRSDKMEEGDDPRTMECLRGRLVAERQTSRTAKEEVELMGNKIMELEKKLSEETQLKNKAEKKLQLLKKRLESLNLSTGLMKTDQASSGGSSENSCLSSTDSPVLKYPEENEAELKISGCFLSQKNTESSPSDTIADHKKALIEEEEESGKTQVYGSSNSSAEDYFADQSSSSSNSSMAEKAKRNEISLSLVAISLPQKTELRETKPVSDRASEVLDSLKHLREMMQISLERRSNLIQA